MIGALFEQIWVCAVTSLDTVVRVHCMRGRKHSKEQVQIARIMAAPEDFTKLNGQQSRLCNFSETLRL